MHNAQPPLASLQRTFQVPIPHTGGQRLCLVHQRQANREYNQQRPARHAFYQTREQVMEAVIVTIATSIKITRCNVKGGDPMKRTAILLPLLLTLILVVTGCAREVPVTVVATPTPGPTPTPIVQEVVVTPSPLEVVPLPNTAAGPAIPQEKGYLVEEIRDGLYWVTEGVYNTMFLTTGEGVIVVDAPPTIGENLLRAIEEVTDEPITHVIYSHTHADHIGAASMYPSDAIYIAHEETAAQLSARANDPNRTYPFGSFLGGSPVPIPTTTFEDRFTLKWWWE